MGGLEVFDILLPINVKFWKRMHWLWNELMA